MWSALAVLVSVALLLSTLLSANLPDDSMQAKCDPKSAVTEMLQKQGFDRSAFEFISDETKFSNSAEVNHSGSAAFASSPVLTTKQLDELLKSTGGRTAFASKIVKSRLKGREVTWVGVQFLIPIDIQGNLGVNGTKVINLGTRKSAKGDVVWFPVSISECKVVKDIVIRAGCGNPGKTVVPTDTPTSRHCPRGQLKNVNGVCVTPKSSDPKDYTYPSGKPKVPTVTTPAEDKPPAVQTVKTGGGGVIDTPTNTPGSESGVTAPGATPAPTTPTPKPTNEGGSNNGTVTGF
jgi:hypothetical protein